MQKFKNRNALLSAVFVATELSLYIAIQLSSGVQERIFCFASVLLAAVFAWLFFSAERKKVLLLFGLLFTVCADVFLVLILPQQRLLAMCFFSVAQMCYFLRIFFEHEGRRVKKIHLFTRGIAASLALVLTVAVLGKNADALSLVSMFYFANLLTNVAFAHVNLKRLPTLAIGLLLFTFCDIIVGLSLIDMYIPISEDSLIYKLGHTEFNLIWTFYVPSQTLIALSAVKK